MNEKEIGDVASLQIKLYKYDHDNFCMKEPDYTMTLMFTYGGLTMNNGQQSI